MRPRIRQEVLHKIYQVYQSWLEGRRFACARGCSSCCTGNVMVTALEGDLILSQISKSSRQKWLAGRLNDRAGSKCNLTMNEWAGQCMAGTFTGEISDSISPGSCPFLLDDHSCPFYEARPFACRCFVSLSSCRQGGAASQPRDLVAINTAVMQIIEHLDQGEIYGPLAQVLAALSNRGTDYDIREFPPSGLNNQNNDCRGLRMARPLPGFVTEKEDREPVQRFLGLLFKEKIKDRTIRDILNNG